MPTQRGDGTRDFNSKKPSMIFLQKDFTIPSNLNDRSFKIWHFLIAF